MDASSENSDIQNINLWVGLKIFPIKSFAQMNTNLSCWGCAVIYGKQFSLPAIFEFSFRFTWKKWIQIIVSNRKIVWFRWKRVPAPWIWSSPPIRVTSLYKFKKFRVGNPNQTHRSALSSVKRKFASHAIAETMKGWDR